MKFLLRLLWRRAGRNLNMDKIAREAFATFQLPAAPPTGSRVRSSRTGDVFRRLPASAVPELLTDPEAERIMLQWGLWECAATGVGWAWPQLLSQFGPVALLPNDEDREEARLYGPIGQRWGDPTKPCPHGSCRYGMFHIGPHEEADPMIQDARVLDLPPVRFSGITRDDPDPCNCGRPAAHLPGCPRHARMAGAAKPEMDWHYGPTDMDPDPARMWHTLCGGEVLTLEGGYICRKCGETQEPSPPADVTLE